MKIYAQPNIFTQEKQKIITGEVTLDNDKEVEATIEESNREEDSMTNRSKFDDDYDNWFPWETH